MAFAAPISAQQTITEQELGRNNQRKIPSFEYAGNRVSVDPAKLQAQKDEIMAVRQARRQRALAEAEKLRNLAEIEEQMKETIQQIKQERLAKLQKRYEGD